MERERWKNAGTTVSITQENFIQLGLPGSKKNGLENAFKRVNEKNALKLNNLRGKTRINFCFFHINLSRKKTREYA
jgi:hypothetical protein